MPVLAVDLETYSDVDIYDCGLYAYTASPAFEILLLAYGYDDGPVQIIDVASGEELPAQLLQDLTDAAILKTAFNAQFERTCLARHLKREMPPEQWSCSMIQALTLGLPQSLAGVAEALKLDERKDAGGKILINYFCKPCKATKTNGNRTRNRPHHDQAKWEAFKAYCKQDVETERDLRKHLARYQPHSESAVEFERRLWCLDQRMNDRGIALDLQLVTNAIALDQAYKARLEEEAIQLTGLDNPNSVQQLKLWLSEAEGLEVDALTKQTVPELLKQAEGETTKRVLTLRQELSRTSTSKYEAMQRAACPDGRARGLLQYYGARTGRWTGRLIQVQNLPQNHLKDLDLARHLLRDGQQETIETLYDVPDTLSQLIRTALVPSEGNEFIAVDFSAIEARVIAWLAGEEWRLDVFSSHGKIYEASASQMFRVPIEQITKGSPLRQKGKIAELACIAEGQLVLTDKGLVPIEEVTLQLRLWDGEEFVEHDGVACRGVKEVITYGGLTATPDHLVWVEGAPRPVRFEDAATRCARLVLTGDRGQAIRLGRDYQPGEAMERRLEQLLCSDSLHELRPGAVDEPEQPDPRPIERLSGVLTAPPSTALAGASTDGREAALHESDSPQLCELRRPGNQVQLPISARSRTLDHSEPRVAIDGHGTGPDRQRRQLRAGEPPVRAQEGESGQQAHHGAADMEPRRVALRPDCCHEDAVTGPDERANHRKRSAGSAGQAQELAGDRREARVYDILNAGPRHRFTVSDCLVHNCGFGGGTGALERMGALKMGLTAEELPDIIRTWRTANPKIVQYWRDVEERAIAAVTGGGPGTLPCGILFQREGLFLYIRLPSGRCLVYVQPQVNPDPRYGRPQLTFMGSQQGRWVRGATFGGRLVENIVQATARDCLAVALTRLADAGCDIAFHVHDEAIVDVPADKWQVKDIIELVTQPIDWAPGLPLRADGFKTLYYKKDD